MRIFLHFFAFIILPMALALPARAIDNVFVENKGQIADFNGMARNDIICYGTIPGGTVYVTNEGVSLVRVSTIDAGYTLTMLPTDYDNRVSIITRSDIGIPAIGNKQHLLQNKSSWYYNYYLPQCNDGIIDAASYRSIEYPEIFEGVSLQMTINSSKMVISIVSASVTAQVKQLYDEIIGSVSKNGLEDCFEVQYAGNSSENSLKNKKDVVQAFNDNIAWSSFIGGSSSDEAISVVVDSEENIIVGGATRSLDFPTTAGSFQKNYKGNLDNFLMKFNKKHELLWCTYIGSSDFDAIFDVHTGSDNGIWFCGECRNRDYPTSNDAFQKYYGGGTSDGCFGKFSKYGYRNYLTLYGGSGYESFNVLDLDASNNAYLTGRTRSGNFPISASTLRDSVIHVVDTIIIVRDSVHNHRDTVYNVRDIIIKIGSRDSSKANHGMYDATIVKFDNCFRRVYSTCWGGTWDEFGEGIGVDKYGNVIISGSTYSNDYPVRYPVQRLKSGLYDGFVAKFDKNFKMLWSTYYGGNSNDYASKLVVDSKNNIVVRGYSQSNHFDTMVKTKSFQPYNAGAYDEFVLKLANDGRLLWSTFYGGSGDEGRNTMDTQWGGIAVDKDNNIAVCGNTQSPNLYVCPDAISKTRKGHQDASLLLLDENGKYLYSSYIGGSSDNENGSDLAFNASNELLMVGWTDSKDFYTTANAFQKYNRGGWDAFIMEMGHVEKPADEDSCDETAFEYPDFVNDENISYVGKASRFYKSIRLTPSSALRVGAAWYKNRMPVAKGFTTEFAFKISGRLIEKGGLCFYDGADGFAFVIQNNSNKIVGGNSGKIGYDPIPNSIAVEFDLFRNDERQPVDLYDPNANHIAVMTMGEEPNSSDHLAGGELGIAKNIMTINTDGTIYYSKIDYNIEEQSLRIFLSNVEGSYGKPVLVIDHLNLKEMLKLTDDEWAYAGFTAATGVVYENHDILAWSFCPRPTDNRKKPFDDGEVVTRKESEMTNRFVDEFFNSIMGDNKGRVQIYNLMGEVMKDVRAEGNTAVNISDLPRGQYFVRIIFDNGEISSENIIKR